MRQGHFSILFFIIFVTCFVLLWKEQKNYDKVLEEKQRIEKALIKAIETTAKEFSDVIHDSTEKKKRIVESVFLESLYVELGIFDKKDEQEKLKMYLPLLVLVEEDGILFYHMQEVYKNGIIELQHVWNEKMMLFFPENSVPAKKKQILSQWLEEYASELISEHNYIAEQYGIEYEFSAPDFLQNTAENLEFPMLFVVFQGWPLTSTGDIVYENCIDASVFLQEIEFYVVKLPEDLENTICFYHKKDCRELSREEEIWYVEWVTEEEAVRKYGAFPCEICLNYLLE